MQTPPVPDDVWGHILTFLDWPDHVRWQATCRWSRDDPMVDRSLTSYTQPTTTPSGRKWTVADVQRLLCMLPRKPWLERVHLRLPQELDSGPGSPLHRWLHPSPQSPQQMLQGRPLRHLCLQHSALTAPLVHAILDSPRATHLHTLDLYIAMDYSFDGAQPAMMALAEGLRKPSGVHTSLQQLRIGNCRIHPSTSVPLFTALATTPWPALLSLCIDLFHHLDADDMTAVLRQMPHLEHLSLRSLSLRPSLPDMTPRMWDGLLQAFVDGAAPRLQALELKVDTTRDMIDLVAFAWDKALPTLTVLDVLWMPWTQSLASELSDLTAQLLRRHRFHGWFYGCSDAATLMTIVDLMPLGLDADPKIRVRRPPPPPVRWIPANKPIMTCYHEALLTPAQKEEIERRARQSLMKTNVPLPPMVVRNSTVLRCHP